MLRGHEIHSSRDGGVYLFQPLLRRICTQRFYDDGEIKPLQNLDVEHSSEIGSSSCRSLLPLEFFYVNFGDREFKKLRDESAIP